MFSEYTVYFTINEETNEVELDIDSQTDLRSHEAPHEVLCKKYKNFWTACKVMQDTINKDRKKRKNGTPK